jgi:hypothetical protein
LCAILVGSSLPAWDEHPLGIADDAACFSVAAWQSVDHPHVGADTTAPGQPEHCVYCHLQRAVAGAAIAHPPVLFVPVPFALVLGSSEHLMLAVAAPARPSRAPPVSVI